MDGESQRKLLTIRSLLLSSISKKYSCLVGCPTNVVHVRLFKSAMELTEQMNEYWREVVKTNILQAEGLQFETVLSVTANISSCAQQPVLNGWVDHNVYSSSSVYMWWCAHSGWCGEVVYSIWFFSWPLLMTGTPSKINFQENKLWWLVKLNLSKLWRVTSVFQNNNQRNGSMFLNNLTSTSCDMSDLLISVLCAVYATTMTLKPQLVVTWLSGRSIGSPHPSSEPWDAWTQKLSSIWSKSCFSCTWLPIYGFYKPINNWWFSSFPCLTRWCSYTMNLSFDLKP